MFKLSFTLFFILPLLSCNLKTNDKGEGNKYFNLINYFDTEIKRLNAKHQKVAKQVFVNNQSEKKIIIPKNWKQELTLFTDNHINKASWKGEFKIKADKNLVIYTTNNPKIPVKLLSVSQKDKKVTAIKIITSVKNNLYTSADTLSYTPESGYQIINRQTIKLLKPRRYQVIGRFIN